MAGSSLEKILIIQTAFIGDVILATGLVEKLYQHYPESNIDVLVRKGNEGLLKGHPIVNKVLIFDKKRSKYLNLFRLINQIRKTRYNMLLNVQRYFTTGLISALSGADIIIGFDKNPLSLTFSKQIAHTFKGKHEIERNHELIAWFTDDKPARPKLYPLKENFEAVKKYIDKSYICISPASVWFTKQFPPDRYIKLLNRVDGDIRIYLTGGPGDYDLCEYIKSGTSHINTINLCGKINFLESAALMKGARLNITNDSAPLHIASAINAPTCAIFCSTVPAFGYGPLADESTIVQRKEPLYCRPCGIHGRVKCPEKHFKCALEIDLDEIHEVIHRAISR